MAESVLGKALELLPLCGQKWAISNGCLDVGFSPFGGLLLGMAKPGRFWPSPHNR